VVPEEATLLRARIEALRARVLSGAAETPKH